ncbi:type II secretion system protein GspG [Aurantivibrio infirmus]
MYEPPQESPTETENTSRFSGYAVLSILIILPTFFLRYLPIGGLALLGVAISGLIFAALAWRDISKSKEQVKGGWLAIIGALLNFFVFAILVAAMFSTFIVTHEDQIFEDLHKNAAPKLREYRNKNQCYPLSNAVFHQLQDIPLDPWGREYIYSFSSGCSGGEEGGFYSISSYGRDGQLGGINEDSDYIYRSDIYGLSVNGEIKIF